ncbi:hypothetical protein MRB53_012261 [Persea americana]|uniref:Uncharacterized protein n=1 Tax=Persea americana TaxID=3435 RepID=A0ACC2LY88_PERAE|nr:hypothetical protein MRB53_012261 [Persea americana]
MAAVEKKLPLQNSNAFNAGGKKTIEETYQKKTQLEHILLRPDTYVGSIEKHTQTLWVYDDDEGMVCRPITYVPGLYKIFDEILVNAADNKQRDPSMDSVKVDIDVEHNCISIYNNGDGVPIEIHQEEGVYVPELIFGHLLTSSNYDDNVRKTTGGRNGYGAKLTNIFSTEFIIQTADGKRQKKYKQVFTNNMGNKSEPSITKCKESENWTKVTFKPDLAKFKMTELEADVVALMKKRVLDLAGCLGKTVKVELNGKRIPVKSFLDYVDLYLKSTAKSRGEESLPRVTEKVNDRWEVSVSLSDGHFQQVSFVNGIATIKGGTHVDYVTNQIANHLVNIVNKQKKDANMKPHAVKNHLWVFVNALIDNPAFDSQTKETLTTRQATHTKTKKVLSFYTMPEFESWKESLGDNAKSWSTKYYKGLGTSTSEEGKTYFKDIKNHMKEFVWEDEQDGDLIELAFSKKKIDARKNWLRQFEPGTYLDQKEKHIKYKDFINKELILFSIADLQRSIPSMVDGLKPGQRKILFCSFKKNLFKELKVQQFSGYVSEHSAYHHGEQSLASTIIGMAQNFVGSNNINLLRPIGQFGTRHQGGKDHASARYIYTALSPVTRFLFPKDDDVLLDYLNEDGQSIEPSWYMPILPMVLVNGSEGIGTGWSSYVPNYNPRELVANVKRLLNGEPMQPMDPWYKGFKGLIEKLTKEGGGAGVSYNISGIIEEVDETTLRVTELPIRRWTEDYKEFLESMLCGTEKIKEPFIKDFQMHNGVTTVHFEIILPEDNLKVAREEGLIKKFKLSSTISTTNMHLFDERGMIKKYDSPEQILEEFFPLRLENYSKRKRVMLESLELELLKLDNKVRFILAVVNGEIIVNNRKKADLLIELKQKGFTPSFPNKTKSGNAAAEDEAAESEENEEDVGNHSGVKAGDYAYLLAMPIGTLTLEKVQELLAEKSKQENQVEELKKETPKSLWMKDLDAFLVALDEQDRQDAAEADDVPKGVKANAAKAARQGVKNPRKNNTKKASNADPVVEASSTSSGSSASDNVAGNVSEVVKPKGKGKPPKKAPSKKQQKPTAIDSDEDEELLELKERLAAYNIESPDQTVMETDVTITKETKKREPKKRTATQKPQSTFTEISDDDEDIQKQSIPEEEDETFQPAAIKGGKKGGGRKAANANANGAARKQGAATAKNKPVLGQKLITEILMKPAEEAGSSPEKKVRKMRASPFNKKSGSVLGRINNKKDGEENSESSPSSSPGQEEEVNVAPRARSQRNRQAAKHYVLSDDDDDDESEGVEEVTDDSDFNGEED